MNRPWSMVPLRELLTPVSRPEAVDPQKTYHILGAHWYATGLYTKDIKSGSEIQAKHLYRAEQGDFVYNRLFAWKGSLLWLQGKIMVVMSQMNSPVFQLTRRRLIAGICGDISAELQCGRRRSV